MSWTASHFTNKMVSLLCRLNQLFTSRKHSCFPYSSISNIDCTYDFHRIDYMSYYYILVLIWMCSFHIFWQSLFTWPLIELLLFNTTPNLPIYMSRSFHDFGDTEELIRHRHLVDDHFGISYLVGYFRHNASTIWAADVFPVISSIIHCTYILISSIYFTLVFSSKWFSCFGYSDHPLQNWYFLSVASDTTIYATDGCCW